MIHEAVGETSGQHRATEAQNEGETWSNLIPNPGALDQRYVLGKVPCSLRSEAVRGTEGKEHGKHMPRPQ